MLRRRIGEGSFVGVKKPQTKEALVEWLKHLYAYKYAENFVDKGYLKHSCMMVRKIDLQDTWGFIQ